MEGWRDRHKRPALRICKKVKKRTGSSVGCWEILNGPSQCATPVHMPVSTLRNPGDVPQLSDPKF